MKQFFILVVLLLTFPTGAPAQETYDVILRNGAILDGTGAKGRRADIAVRNGFIYRIGDLRGVRATVEVDVTGLIVAPGFINLHSHADPAGVRLHPPGGARLAARP